ncbi:MAG: exopolyphosphatase [Bacteroidota bacterium]|nr:exopolyphosphatase [Flavisolibacter sp.]MDQ3551899.1 exopolyphosphatase [Bacteroidota bacterium]
MKLAAIDIGSNAARLLINDVVQIPDGPTNFIKLSLVRVPLRLGFDVFETGTLSDSKVDKLIKTIQSYKLLLDVYEVDHLKACATSAMRDAANAAEVLQLVKENTGIDLQVISGQEEATFIYENHVADNMNKEDSYLYIDVGGGSTELTFFSDGRLVSKNSFNIGTIRLLKNQVPESAWDDMRNFLKTQTKGYHHIACIGSGGNINKIFSLSKRKVGKPLTLELLRNYYREFSSITLSQRMNLYKLREDRADVIVPALLIFINVMRWVESEEIHVPQIGLADGLIHILYDEITAKHIVH